MTPVLVLLALAALVCLLVVRQRRGRGDPQQSVAGFSRALQALRPDPKDPEPGPADVERR